MRLSWPYDVGPVYNKLTKIDSSYFLIYFLWDYPDLMIQVTSWWINLSRLGLLFYFFLLIFFKLSFNTWLIENLVL